MQSPKHYIIVVMKSTEKNEITSGVIWKQILIFFFPILIGAIFQTLYNTVDAVVVGRFSGKIALASVGGSSGLIIELVITFFMGLASGATVIISQAYGSDDRRRIDEALHTAYTFALAGGLILGSAGVLLAPAFLHLLGTPDDLFPGSLTYLRILMAGLAFILIYNIGSGILCAIGDSRRPLYILIVCCVINIALDLWLVAVLKMGVAGAGIATVISQGVSAALVTWLLVLRTGAMKLSLKRLHINLPILSNILKIGLPTAISVSMFTISNMILQTSINRMGSNTVAAWTAYGRVDAFWWLITEAFSVSITTFVGQNYGAKKPQRIKRAILDVIGMELVLSVIAAIVIVSAAPFLISMFTRSQAVITIGARISKVIAPIYWIFIPSDVLSSSLRAENHVVFSTITNTLSICIFRIFWTFLTGNRDITFLLRCYPISYIAASSLIIIYFVIEQKKINSKLS